MKPFFVLLISFIVSLFVIKWCKGLFDYSLSGSIAMAVMLMFTAFGHFKFPKGMAMMIPNPVPFKMFIVYISGIFEILLGIALLFPSIKNVAAWSLIIFFVLILPSNIYAAYKNVNLEKANYEGAGLSYLWWRVPLQIFFIAWVYFFCIYL